MEGDCFWALSRSVPTTFQSTPSAWRETASISGTTLVRIFQSTPSAWRETKASKIFRKVIGISIHSLRMEGDMVLLDTYCIYLRISIHSLRMEGDFVLLFRDIRNIHFNPLPPHGGRPFRRRYSRFYSHFNPLPPHGGRL